MTNQFLGKLLTIIAMTFGLTGLAFANCFGNACSGGGSASGDFVGYVEAGGSNYGYVNSNKPFVGWGENRSKTTTGVKGGGKITKNKSPKCSGCGKNSSFLTFYGSDHQSVMMGGYVFPTISNTPVLLHSETGANSFANGFGRVRQNK